MDFNRKEHKFKKFNLKEIIFVDLEMACWENTKPENAKHEITEIGIVKVNNISNKITDIAQYYIKNEYDEITEYNTNLTGITQEILDNKGIPFSKACKLIKTRFGTLNKTWFAWGCGDFNRMQADCILKNTENPMSNNYINFAEIYALNKSISRNISLKKASIENDIFYRGNAHSAVVDALVTAELYLSFIKNIKDPNERIDMDLLDKINNKNY